MTLLVEFTSDSFRFQSYGCRNVILCLRQEAKILCFVVCHSQTGREDHQEANDQKKGGCRFIIEVLCILLYLYRYYMYILVWSPDTT